MDIFSQWLDGLNAILTVSFGFFENETMAITSGIITLAIMALGGQIMFGAGGIMGPTVNIALRGGATIALLTIGRGIGEWITAGASQLGSAIGGAGSFNAFAGSPDEIYMLGLSRLADLWSLANKACEVSSYFGCMGNLQGYIPASAAGYIVALCFFVISLAVFSVTVLFKLGFIVGIILMPFALLGGPFSFIGWPFFKFLTTFFVQITVLSAVTAFGSQMFQNYAVGINPGIESTIDVLTGAVLFMCVVLGSSLIARALSGSVVGDHGMIARAAGMVGGGRHVERLLSSVPVGGRGGGHGDAAGRYPSFSSGGDARPALNVTMNTSAWSGSGGGAGSAWRHGGTVPKALPSPPKQLPKR